MYSLWFLISSLHLVSSLHTQCPQYYWWKWTDYHVVLAISNKIQLNSVLQFCVGILMLCVKSDGQQCHWYPQKSVCGCAKAVPEFPTLYVLVFIVVSDFKVRGDCFVDIDGIIHNHVLRFLYIITSHIESLNIKRFMFCKSQHGKIERIWYLQLIKA